MSTTTTVDRIALIRQAAEKTAFKTKVQKKTRKVARNVKAGRKALASVDAFDEAFMYDDEKTIRRVVKESGIDEIFAYTTKFDDQWN